MQAGFETEPVEEVSTAGITELRQRLGRPHALVAYVGEGLVIFELGIETVRIETDSSVAGQSNKKVATPHVIQEIQDPRRIHAVPAVAGGVPGNVIEQGDGGLGDRNRDSCSQLCLQSDHIASFDSSDADHVLEESGYLTAIRYGLEEETEIGRVAESPDHLLPPDVLFEGTYVDPAPASVPPEVEHVVKRTGESLGVAGGMAYGAILEQRLMQELELVGAFNEQATAPQDVPEKSVPYWLRYSLGALGLRLGGQDRDGWCVLPHVPLGGEAIDQSRETA
ncbi:hypothetical protein ACWGKQ_18660 [Streptomyces sp. NPDC054770]